MITPTQIPNPYVKPKWSASVGTMTSVVAYNCRKYGMPRPVLAMPLWERAGNRVFDLSGYGHHGTLTGQPDWVADGLYFVSANNDYIGISPTSILAQLQNSSVVMQIKSTQDGGLGGDALYCERTTGIPIWKLEIAHSAHTLSFTHRDDTSHLTQIVSINDVSDGNVNTVAVTKAGTAVKLYKNGAVENSTVLSGNDTLTAGNVRIGGDYADNAADFGGEIYFCYAYNSTLSAAQIKFLHYNPYFMYRLPEELYGYTSGAPPAVSIPVFMHHYNQMRQ